MTQRSKAHATASKSDRLDKSGGAARKQLVLAISEDSEFLIDLWTRLASRSAVSVQIAENERTALNALSAYPVRAVVLDLRMRDLRALDLLRRFGELQPAPSVVLVSSGEPRAIEHMLRAVGEPVIVRSCTDVSSICEAVGLAIESDMRRLRPLTPAVLAALVSAEKGTCTIRLEGSSGPPGVVSFSSGLLVDARAGDLTGVDAAVQLLATGARPFAVDSAVVVPSGPISLLVRDVLAQAIVSQAGIDPAPVSHPRAPIPSLSSTEATTAIPAPADAERGPAITQETHMALENLLQPLREIKGYKASGIMHFTGELLAYDSTDTQINLPMVGATFNDIFRSAHEASKKIGLDACRETTIVTPKGVIVMACSGVDSKAHVHLIGVLTADGNHSLMKMQISKLLSDTMAALA